MLFNDLSLAPNLLKSIADIGFTSCTDVQEQTLQHALSGKDVFVQSQTGTGKTAAFLISLFELFERSEYKERALIIVPTRELATQIEAEARELSVHLNYSFVSIYGGVGYDQQEQAIANDVDIIIGTPGRLVDLCKKRTLNLSKFTFAVIDEADRMFDMGFVKDIRFLIKSMTPQEIRQTMLFSATLDYSIKKLAEEFMNDPIEIAIAPETMTVDKINQQLYHVGKHDKMKLTLGLITKESNQQVIVFSNTKRMCEEISERLRYNGIQAEYLTGDLAQAKRQKRVDQFKKKEFPVLVATDVAARGIHIDNLDLVINYDIPQHAENYVHRIGRTARAGESGNAITLACETFVEYLEPIQELIGMKIPSLVADESDFGDDKSGNRNWKKKPTNTRERQNSRGNNRGNDSRTYKKGGTKPAKKSYTTKFPKDNNSSTGNKNRKVWDPSEPKTETNQPKKHNKKRAVNPNKSHNSKTSLPTDQPKHQNNNRNITAKDHSQTKSKKSIFGKITSIFKR